MTGYLICHDGRRVALPELVEWRLCYTAGVPCDSFSIRCLWLPEDAGILAAATRFTAEEDGAVVFSGVVDECECGWDGAGGTLTVTGRGMAALLLDNEALGADYQVATLADILRSHVTPYGITVLEAAQLPAVPGFSVATGSSEWQALYEFARYYGGVTPRFDRAGRLIIAPWRDGGHKLLDDDAPVTALHYRQRRYGVCSEILVRDRTTDTVQRVAASGFVTEGGRCRRVLTMPGRSSYQAMRYSGEYQLAQSAQERERVTVTLAQAFCAWPGELVELRRKDCLCRGIWRVAECETGLNAGGCYSTLTLAPPDAVR